MSLNNAQNRSIRDPKMHFVCRFISCLSNIWLIIVSQNELFPRSRREQNKTTKKAQNVQKCQHSGIWWLYLHSPWGMHWNKYKHAWHWFKKLWNFKNFVKQNDFVSWMMKRMAACKVLICFHVWREPLIIFQEVKREPSLDEMSS